MKWSLIDIQQNISFLTYSQSKCTALKTYLTPPPLNVCFTVRSNSGGYLGDSSTLPFFCKRIRGSTREQERQKENKRQQERKKENKREQKRKKENRRERKRTGEKEREQDRKKENKRERQRKRATAGERDREQK